MALSASPALLVIRPWHQVTSEPCAFTARVPPCHFTALRVAINVGSGHDAGEGVLSRLRKCPFTLEEVPFSTEWLQRAPPKIDMLES